jgi:hypothetical protein
MTFSCMTPSLPALSGTAHAPYTWTAELLEDLPRNRRPVPFQKIEHDFPSLDELCAWLGHPPVKTNNRHTTSQGV